MTTPVRPHTARPITECPGVRKFGRSMDDPIIKYCYCHLTTTTLYHEKLAPHHSPLAVICVETLPTPIQGHYLVHLCANCYRNEFGTE